MSSPNRNIGGTVPSHCWNCVPPSSVFSTSGTYIANGYLEMTPVVQNSVSNYCTSATTCAITFYVRYAGDAILVAAQNQAGTTSVADSFGNSWGTATSQNLGTSFQSSIFYVGSTNKGGQSDTITITAPSGTIALEALDVSGMGDFQYVTSQGKCTGGSCGTSISTSSLGFWRPMVAVGSIAASPGYGFSCGGSPGPGFNEVCGTFNAWKAMQYSVFTNLDPPTTFPATDGTSSSQWIEVGAVFESDYFFTSAYSYWTVPQAPSNGNFAQGQNLAFFNALQSDVDNGYSRSGTDIVQPLLAYGATQTGLFSWVGGNYWYALAYMALGGTVYAGSVLRVSVGDTIEGEITWNPSYSGCSGNGPIYTAIVWDTSMNPPQSSSVAVCSYDLFNEYQPAALEEHSLNYCNQLPNTTSEAFSSISYSVQAGGTLTPGYFSYYGQHCSSTASWGSGHTSITLGWSSSGNI